MSPECSNCKRWREYGDVPGYGTCHSFGVTSAGYWCELYKARADMAMQRPNESERGWASLSVRPRLADDQPTEVTITVSVTRDDQQAITALLNAVRGCGFAVTDAETDDRP